MATNKKNFKRREYDKKRDSSKPNRNSRGNTFKEEVSKSSEFSYDKCHSNDISWWNKAKPVYDNVTKIPFNRIYGDRFTLGNERDNLKVLGRSYAEPIPAVMAIDYIPTIGTALDATDAVNLAFDALYARIYREYTGAANFTKSELAFHVLHAQGIATYIAECKRILRTLNSYAIQNHNLPRTLYAAECGHDTVANTATYMYFESDVNALPNLRARLNQTIYNFNSLYIPKFTDVFDRWYTLSSNVWMDEDSIEATAYIFRTAGHYEYVEASASGGTVTPAKLQWVFNRAGASATPNVSRFETLIGYANQLLAEIRNSSNFSIVNAAIAKVYGDSRVTIDYFSEGELLQPVFDRNMMYQIQNMDIFGMLVNSSLDVTEDVLQNVLIYKPTAQSTAYHYGSNTIGGRFLNSYDYNISDEFIMEATRLKPTYLYGYPSTQFTGAIDYTLMVGTEIPYGIQFYYNGWDWNGSGALAAQISNRGVRFTPRLTSSLIAIESNTSDYYSVVNSGFTSAVEVFTFVSLLSRMRFHPYLYLSIYGNVSEDAGATTTTLNQSNYFASIGDVVKYTIINDEGITGLHTAALLSAYYIGV